MEELLVRRTALSVALGELIGSMPLHRRILLCNEIAQVELHLTHGLAALFLLDSIWNEVIYMGSPFPRHSEQVEKLLEQYKEQLATHKLRSAVTKLPES